MLDWFVAYLTPPPRRFTDYQSWGTWEIGTPGFIFIIALAIFVCSAVAWFIRTDAQQLPWRTHSLWLAGFAALGLVIGSTIALVYHATGLL